MQKAYLIIGIILSLCLWLEYKLIMPNDLSIKEYDALLQKCYDCKESKKEPFAAIQKKVGVFKDIFFEKSNQKLQMRIFSDSCEFVYQQTDLGTEMFEKLDNVNCILQEELFFDAEKNEDVQIIKLIKAKDAIYSLSEDKLLAHNAKIMQYKIKGKEIPSHFVFEGLLLMDAFVEKAEIIIQDKEVILHANDFKGNFLRQK